MPSPPKPWERAGVVANNTGNTSSLMAPTTAAPIAPASSVSSSSTAVENSAAAGTTPAVPARPSSLTQQQPLASTSASLVGSNAYSPYNRFGSTYSPYGATAGYGTTGYGTSGYGGYGGYGGGYGNSMYGSSMYGNSMYGGMGYGAASYMGGGMGMPGMGMPGMMMQPGADQSLTAQLSNTTQHTFALLHSIVQTFGGFAQMLDSTFMATHSSFFAIVGVIDQFAALRDVLGHVLGVFGLIRWAKGVLSGEGVVPRSALTDEFNAFVNNAPGPNGARPGASQKPSKKPIIVFLLAMFGIPYLMHKLIRRLADRPPLQLMPSIDPVTGQPILAPQPQQQIMATDASGQPIPLDASKLSFAQALYAFDTTATQELALKKGDIVAVLSRHDPVTGVEGEWWRGRTRDGREGWFPKGFVEIIQRKGQESEGPKVVKVVD